MAAASSTARPEAIPAHAGIGLRAAHYREILESRPALGWLEVHSENYFGEGGAPHRYLEALRAHYPLSLHGVGLSLGSSDELSIAHLRKLKALIERYEPGLVSEHLSWGSVDGRFFNDLLPLPYTEESLAHLVERVVKTQDTLDRQILVENPSTYLRFVHSTIPEAEFLSALAERSGCGILLDVNNVCVSARNHGTDPHAYLAVVRAQAVAEIHLAGFTVNRFDDGEILIDTHSRPVDPQVWALYREALERLGPLPTLIEWDADIPPLPVLIGEANQAQHILEEVRRDLAA
jgi:uncharacterized protein (UPF0276 family)